MGIRPLFVALLAAIPSPITPAFGSVQATPHATGAAIRHGACLPCDRGWDRVHRRKAKRTVIIRVIRAANEIARKPYVYGGGHGSFYAEGYDCSGSVSYALHGGGLLGEPRTSGEFEFYGRTGSGRHISIYANEEHVWMTIEGRRFDTSAQREDGSRWSRTLIPTFGYITRHPAGF